MGFGFSQKTIPLLMLAFVSIGCSVDSDRSDTSLTEPERDSGENACLAVVNGRATTGYDPVVMLMSKTSACTGTFIAHNALLTAAHCMDDSETGGMRYVKGDSFLEGEFEDDYKSGIKPKTMYYEGPINGSTIDYGEVDLAILIFEDNTAPAVYSLLDRNPTTADTIKLVGFGLTDIDEQRGIDRCHTINKMVGENNDLKLDDELDGLYYSGRTQSSNSKEEANDAINLFGDSGGPIIINGMVAGVVSAVAVGTDGELEDPEKAFNYSVDLSTSASQDFIDEVVSTENLTLGQ